MNKYIFTSDRLGFRERKDADLPLMHMINLDKDVMEFFPAIPTESDTLKFIKKMQKHHQENGFCYFAIEKLENEELIGFIGLMEKDFEATFTPCIDIGWRLKKSEWNKGYATEGAKACLEFAFTHLKLEVIYSMTPVVNTKSQRIMEKIGMLKKEVFIHPALLDNDRLRECVLYEVDGNNVSP